MTAWSASSCRKLDELGIADNTIVVWSTDNGAETFSWPDGGTTPFRSEKATNWEGAVRVPTMIRWPGVIKPGSVFNGIASHEDMLATLVTAAGEPGIVEKCKTGCTAGDQTFKVHLDGYDLQPWLKGDVAELPRKEFLYWNDDGELVALRYNQWKLVFQEQRAEGFDVWQDPYTPLRLPKLFNLRSDPFEQGDRDSIDYAHWRIDRAFLVVPAQAFVGQWLQSFREFPPSQKPASFSLDQVMETLSVPVNQ